MHPTQNVSLRDYSTMRLGGNASYLITVYDQAELVAAIDFADTHHLPILMIGQGSNIVWRDEGFDGLIIANRLKRFEDLDQDGINHLITLGAGEIWDDVVARTVGLGLTGIEALSLIPGTTGATPIQNVGAYGQEIADTLVKVEAYDTASKSLVTIAASDCSLGYRTSRFKTTDKGRFFITAITLHLIQGNPEPPFYTVLQTYLTEHNITTFTPQVIREAVIDIRSHKLPDPGHIANNGSFFANPIVDTDVCRQIAKSYEHVPHWETKDGRIKLAAAWLMEQAGFKDYHDNETGMATWPNQCLVLINEHAKTTADLMKFKRKIIDAVQAKFGVLLEQEPELLP